MDIKWKSKLTVILWMLLITFGITGIMSAILEGDRFFYRGYFQSHQFQHEFDTFVENVSTFDLNAVSREEAKQMITVTDNEIEEHRYRYGDLLDQVTNIKEQYQHKIQEAKDIGDNETANMYIVQRDKKIEDITNNFKSDEYVREKIIKEKEEQIEEHYQMLEDRRLEFLKDQSIYSYYLKNISSGEVHTNIEEITDESIEKVFNRERMAYIKKYPSATNDYLSTEGRYLEVLNDNDIRNGATKNPGTFEGYIAIANADPTANRIMRDYYNFKETQIKFLIFVVTSIIAFLISLFWYKRTPMNIIDLVKGWEPYYNRIPIDIRVILFIITTLLTLTLMESSSPLYFLNTSIWTLFEYILFFVGGTVICLYFSVIQGKFLYEKVKNADVLRNELDNALLFKAIAAIKEVFLNRALGTKIFILLAIIFAFGFGAPIVLINPEFILIYAPLFVVIALPAVFIIIKRIGYFNRIVMITNELIKGNFDSDISVKGKNVLATLANNINFLKHGVKVSQMEQAKSERLKAELITNVSHDLRTPLTSIITYTELLKSPQITVEEREAYVQIIDRKSKRLKVLIDDLFEASKMASGNLKLLKDKVDVVQLMHQALAENDEELNNSTLQFRVKTPDTPIYIFVDGQKLWRVFDNLIGNVLKYSLENTRVYISVQEISEKVVITFKNITKYELGENVDEMLERFKRGDTSRQTEGSGLGLAIAKSIIDLHGGTLDVDLDGDLFKVTLTLNTKFD